MSCLSNYLLADVFGHLVRLSVRVDQGPHHEHAVVAHVPPFLRGHALEPVEHLEGQVGLTGQDDLGQVPPQLLEKEE